MSKAAIAVEGFVSNEPSTRTAGSHTVIDITVPVTPQKFKDGKWEDSGETVWFKASFWDEHVPAILTTIDKGSLVTLAGDGIKATTYGDPVKVSIEISNPQIALVIRRPKKGASSPAPAADEWASTAPTAQPDVWNTPASEDVPF